MQHLRLPAALAAAVCALAGAAQPAAAANLFMGTDDALEYVDLSDQDNQVTVTNGQPGGLLVQDAFALNATQACRPTPSFTLSATCRPTDGRPVQRYSFYLNGGNDSLDLRQASLASDIGALNGGPGTDSILAGGGDDTINLGGDALADTFGCGGGFDVVNADLVDRHAPGDSTFVKLGQRVFALSACEVVNAAPAGELPTVGLPAALHARHGRVAVAVSCPATHDGGPCAGRLTLSRPGAELGSAHFRMARGERRTVRIAVGRASGRVQATATEHDALGRPKTTTRQLVLR
jgi:hypothetical protein